MCVMIQHHDGRGWTRCAPCRTNASHKRRARERRDICAPRPQRAGAGRLRWRTAERILAPGAGRSKCAACVPVVCVGRRSAARSASAAQSAERLGGHAAALVRRKPEHAAARRLAQSPKTCLSLSISGLCATAVTML